MRPEDLFNAVTDIRDDQIEFAKPARSRRRYLVPMAACLALALIALPFLSSRSPVVQPLYTGSAQLARAEYPGSSRAETAAETVEGPYAHDEAAGGKSSSCGYDDSGLWEKIEQGRREYFNRRDEYSRRLGGFWAESAETFLTADNEENLIFSPVSLYTVLGMSAELCEGGPQEEILDLLGSPDITDLRDSARRIWCASFARDDSTCLLANSLWLSSTVDYKQPVLDILAENYFADSFRGDMGSEEYDLMHLDWLKEKTEGYLDGRLPELETDTLMYLDSTIYYKARWYHEFSPSGNEEGTFHAAYMDQPCTFMNQSGQGEYYKGENFTATAKYMYGSQELLFVLPEEGTSPNELLADPEYKRFISAYLEDPAGWENKGYSTINLSVPKFDITSDMDMAPGLREMGVSGIFEGGSGSFAPIADQDFSFTGVKHACRVSLDEEGCEAASVMIAPASGASAPPEEELDFRLDRPFLFMVIGNESLPIYMGVVNQITE